MVKIKSSIDLKMEPVEVTFVGELIDDHENGDFYYEIRPQVKSITSIPAWERAVAANMARRRRGDKIVQELKQLCIKAGNKAVKRRRK